MEKYLEIYGYCFFVVCIETDLNDTATLIKDFCFLFE